MGLSFVPVTIASLTGVERSDAGVASGLSTRAARSAARSASPPSARSRRRRRATTPTPTPAVTAASAAALDHGFQTALYVLTGLLLAGAVIVVTLMRPAQQPSAATAPADAEAVVLDEAA